MCDYEHRETTLTKNVVTTLLQDRSKYCFVETGTNVGAAITLALQLGFPRVVSMEYHKGLCDRTRVKFKRETRVVIHHGDSRLILPDICKQVNEPCFFWLDAHSNHENTPLPDELRCIIKRNNPEDVIAIDDVRIIRGGVDQRHTWGDNTSVEQLIEIAGPKFIVQFFDSGLRGPNVCKNDIMTFKQN